MWTKYARLQTRIKLSQTLKVYKHHNGYTPIECMAWSSTRLHAVTTLFASSDNFECISWMTTGSFVLHFCTMCLFHTYIPTNLYLLARWLQGGCACAPVAVWHFAIVPGRRQCRLCRRCSWAATAFHSEPNMRRDADRAFAAAGTGLWNSLPSHLKDADWLIVQWIPAVAKDISVWTVGLRRSVNCINCAT